MLGAGQGELAHRIQSELILAEAFRLNAKGTLPAIKAAPMVDEPRISSLDSCTSLPASLPATESTPGG